MGASMPKLAATTAAALLSVAKINAAESEPLSTNSLDAKLPAIDVKAEKAAAESGVYVTNSTPWAKTALPNQSRNEIGDMMVSHAAAMNNSLEQLAAAERSARKSGYASELRVAQAQPTRLPLISSIQPEIAKHNHEEMSSARKILGLTFAVGVLAWVAETFGRGTSRSETEGDASGPKKS